MIISRIIGGLGNQMFQYAVGRALSLARGQRFCLDVSEFSDYGLHQGFELMRVFDCVAEIATQNELDCVLGWQGLPHVRKLLARNGLSVVRSKKFVVEPHFNYWPGILDVPNDCYLMGYWQSEKYFKIVDFDLSFDFVFKRQLDGINYDLARSMSTCESVGLHVRRGDYVSNVNALAVHGVCSLDYYRRAIRYVSERLENPCFFVFSDDMDWVVENLKIDSPCYYVGFNRAENSYVDMQLMSLCRHNVIANSSFSWWAAWLNRNPEKIVVAPSKWFADGRSAVDLVPSSWIVI